MIKQIRPAADVFAIVSCHKLKTLLENGIVAASRDLFLSETD